MFKNKKAFTLIEMSIVVLIISILFAGTSVIFSKIRGIAQTNDTKDKLEKIEKALKVYFLENEYLPCPANPAIDVTNTNSGKGLRDGTGDDEACILTDIFRNTSDSTDYLGYGAVPYIDLGIPSDYTYDGWGNKFSYVVDLRFTHSSDKAGSTDITENFAGTTAENAILIKDADDVNIKTDVIVIIVSYGLNGLGAYTRTLQIELPSITDDEYDNVYDSSNTPTFDNHFVDNLETSTFDDVLKYVSKETFVKSIAVERIGCLEDGIPSYTYTLNSSDYTINWATSGNCTNELCSYGDVVQASSGCTSGDYPDHSFSKNATSPYYPAKKCLKNGQWSDIMYDCTTGCGDTDGDVTLLTALNAISGTDSAYAITDLDNTNTPWMNTELSQTITLKCDGNKSGSVTVTCGAGGAWAVSSGNCVDVGDLVP